ncbi:MAG: elongation factor Ts [Magnetococcales bacterium]|nr:elongation factor Ts [Magnetococcales bacterium]MBF0322022.1 elongation factor Ts [Magnetococcales bacterium]
MAVTAQMVKELREKTGAGMMDCKKALAEVDGNLEAAVDWLRKKGLSTAAKKASRVASEGKVFAAAKGQRGVLLEVNLETDFASKIDKFIQFGETLAQLALEKAPKDVEALKTLPFPGTGHTVSEELTQQIAAVGENMNIRRYALLETSVPGMVAPYLHMGGKIGVIVVMESVSQKGAELAELGKKMAMHVAAAAPAYLDRQLVPAEALDRERAVLSEQARASGKPENIIAKMVEGRLNKYYAEVCFLDQPFIMDQDASVTKVLQAAAKDLGAPVRCTGFARFVLGEGIEKEQKNFAEEVAQQLG